MFFTPHPLQHNKQNQNPDQKNLEPFIYIIVFQLLSAWLIFSKLHWDPGVKQNQWSSASLRELYMKIIKEKNVAITDLSLSLDCP